MYDYSNMRLTFVTEVAIKWSLTTITEVHIVVIQTFSTLHAGIIFASSSTATFHIRSLSCQLA